MLSIASSRSPDALTASHSIATDKAAIIALFRGMTRYVGRLPPMPGMFPDYQVRWSQRWPRASEIPSVNFSKFVCGNNVRMCWPRSCIASDSDFGHADKEIAKGPVEKPFGHPQLARL
jgi:hypothetical protein